MEKQKTDENIFIPSIGIIGDIGFNNDLYIHINTKKIVLTNNVLNIDLTLENEQFSKLKYIVINGIKFKKEEK